MKEVTKKLPKHLADNFGICAAVDAGIRMQMSVNEIQKRKYFEEIKELGLIPKNAIGKSVDHEKGTVTYRIFKTKKEELK